VVSGGYSNTASGYVSAIGGGSKNTASGGHSFIGGGWYNTASGKASVIGGGWHNTATEMRSSVCGGGGNKAMGRDMLGPFGTGAWTVFSRSAMVCVCDNAAGYFATVCGGRHNYASGNGSAVLGGGADPITKTNGHRAGGTFSSVLGGRKGATFSRRQLFLQPLCDGSMLRRSLAN